MNNPLISVVTVVYNGAATLERTMLSVINQTYKNIEYIIIDGGSADGTVDIIKKHENHLAFWVSEPDRGIYDAMNKGIDKATGEWINFMNCGDCFYNENVVETVFSDKIWNCAVIYGNTNIYTKGRFHFFIPSRRIKRWETVYPMKKRKMAYTAAFTHQSSFVSRAVMAFHKFDDSMKIAADYDFLTKLFWNGDKFEYIDAIVSTFDMEGISSTDQSLRNREHLLVLKRRKRIIPVVIYRLKMFRVFAYHLATKFFRFFS
jgi:glycosyltransferase involved in cell wall biosynthesis